MFREVIEEYNLESDRNTLEAEQKENLELLKLPNGLKRATKEKQSELDNILQKRNAWKKKERLCSFVFFGFFIDVTFSFMSIRCHNCAMTHCLRHTFIAHR